MLHLYLLVVDYSVPGSTGVLRVSRAIEATDEDAATEQCVQVVRREHRAASVRILSVRQLPDEPTAKAA